MSWSPDDPLLWGGVFLLVFVVEVAIILNLKAHRSRTTYEPQTREAVLGEGEQLTDILSRFVDDGEGNRLGETVGMDGDRVIVKDTNRKGYLSLPRAALVPKGESFQVSGDVDWEEARREGDAWRERQHRVVEYNPEELPEDERPSDREA